MTKSFVLHFDEGLPTATAQQKGECICYKGGKPYIHHYRKDAVNSLRKELIYKLNRYSPIAPSKAPIRLSVLVCFNVKDKKLWGKYKTTRPDADNFVKQIKDCMTECGFWEDDAQVVDLRVVKTYSEIGSIRIQVEDLKQPGRISV